MYVIKLKDIKQVNKKLYEFALKNGKKQLFDKVKELQRRLYEMELQNRKLKSQAKR